MGVLVSGLVDLSFNGEGVNHIEYLKGFSITRTPKRTRWNKKIYQGYDYCRPQQFVYVHKLNYKNIDPSDNLQKPTDEFLMMTCDSYSPINVRRFYKLIVLWQFLTQIIYSDL